MSDVDIEAAWRLYCRKGVIVPGCQAAIAARKQRLNEWAAIDSPLV